MSTIDQTEESPRNLISVKEFEQRKYALQVELLKWQHYAKDHGEKHVITFDGFDAAGKGGCIKRFLEHMSPKTAKVVALDKPTETERAQWFWLRYLKELPKAGEIAFYDRSWNNRALVEKVMEFATQKEIDLFFEQAPIIEDLLRGSGIHLIKFWLDVGKKEQSRRFKERAENPLKLGKLSPIDIVSEHKFKEYQAAKKELLDKTTNWVIIDSNCKRSARIAAMQHVLINNDYEGKDINNIGSIDSNILKI